MAPAAPTASSSSREVVEPIRRRAAEAAEFMADCRIGPEVQDIERAAFDDVTAALRTIGDAPHLDEMLGIDPDDPESQAAAALLAMRDHAEAQVAVLRGDRERLLEVVDAQSVLIEELRAQARAASATLTELAFELGWATDGRLPTAVRHASAVLAVRTRQRDDALARLNGS